MATETIIGTGGKIIVTGMTDDEAAAILARRTFQSFATKLISVRQISKLSPPQRYCLHEMAYEDLARERVLAEAECLRLQDLEEQMYGKEPKNFDVEATCRMERIAEFLSRGRSDRIKGTRLRIERGSLTVRFQATERNRTRWPGGFLVIGVFGFARPEMPIARIDANGYLYWSDEARLISDLHAMFEMFENDPVAFVLEHRGMQNNCIFCGRDLIDSVSTELQYGPECGPMRGLPHDNETAAFWKARREANSMQCEAVA